MKRYNWILCPLRYRVSSFEGIRYRAGWFITEIDIPRIAHRSLSAPSIWNFSSQDYNPFLNLRQRENGIALSRKFLISRPEYKNPGRWPFGQFFSPLISNFQKIKKNLPSALFPRLLLFRITYKEEGRHRTPYNKCIQAWKFLVKSAMSQCRGIRSLHKKTGRRRWPILHSLIRGRRLLLNCIIAMMHPYRCENVERNKYGDRNGPLCSEWRFLQRFQELAKLCEVIFQLLIVTRSRITVHTYIYIYVPLTR